MRPLTLRFRLLLAASLLVMPSWPVRWLAAAHGGVHPMPVLQLAGGGPLLLLAWLRWRDPDARLLGALSLVPQTIAPHECFVLFLLCRKWWEGVILTLLIGVAYTVAMSLKAGHAGPSFTTGGQEYIAQQMAANGPVFTALVYLPCLAAVLLRRPLRRHAVDVNGARGNVAGTE